MHVASWADVRFDAYNTVLWCRDICERALRVLRKEAEKYSEVRTRLASLGGLQAAALFQQGLQQHALPTQSPPSVGTS